MISRGKGNIKTVGFKGYLDKNYGAYGGYMEYQRQYELGYNNAHIARHFHVSRTAAKNWRTKYEEGVVV